MFENITDIKLLPPAIKHDTLRRKSYLFMGDHWHEIGDIAISVDFDSPFVPLIRMQTPDIDFYLDTHQQEGALDWYTWGPQVN